MLLESKYKGKLLFVSPGSGKTYVASKFKNIIDVDNLLIEEIKIMFPLFKIDNNISIGENIYGLYKLEKNNADKIYDSVKIKIQDLKKNKNIILTGSLRFIKDVDYIFHQINDKIRLNRPNYNFNKEKEQASFHFKKICKINQYIEHIITK